MGDEMLICRVEFREWKCTIKVEYHCTSKNSINLLYSRSSYRDPYSVYVNYSYASEILKIWNAHDCEIKSFLDELRDPNHLNEVECGIQRAFNIINRD